MIRTVIQAGFGNQLFQYATGYALAKELGCKLELDISFFEYAQNQNASNLRVNNLVRLKLEKPQFINKPLFFLFYRICSKLKFPKMIFSCGHFLPIAWEQVDNCRIDQQYKFNIIKKCKKGIIYGFWQNTCYFEKYVEDLRSQFIPNYDLCEMTIKLYNEIKEKASVGVHIRRGDFVQLGWEKGAEYYLRGMNEMKKMVTNPLFFIVTDDVDWAHTQFDCMDDVKIINIESETKDVDEFFLLSSCKHQIISESTFGWWAAFLNTSIDAKIIVPSSAVGQIFNNKWIRL